MTFEWSVSRMLAIVPRQFIWPGEFPATPFPATLKWFLTSMGSKVCLQMWRFSVCFSTAYMRTAMNYSFSFLPIGFSKFDRQYWRFYSIRIVVLPIGSWIGHPGVCLSIMRVIKTTPIVGLFYVMTLIGARLIILDVTIVMTGIWVSERLPCKLPWRVIIVNSIGAVVSGCTVRCLSIIEWQWIHFVPKAFWLGWWWTNEITLRRVVIATISKYEIIAFIFKNYCLQVLPYLQLEQKMRIIQGSE